MRAPLQTSRLRADVHAVAIDDDAVFLDVARDSYLCIPNVADHLLLDEDRRVLGVSDAGLAQDLRDAGLVCDHVTPPALWRAIAPATTSAMTGPFEPPRWRDALDGAAAMADLARAYWRQPLARFVAWAAAGATEAGYDPPSQPMLEVVAGFHRWSPYAPAPGKCLLRSFMLLRRLRREGHDARWVFGVRTWPFRAHCWLQAGDMVLDDEVEALVPLTPIMVV